ncbi:MAG: AAA family ATPase [Clostridia bacterium]|nr:AAA family ATPase [Clostridia bacterium]
MNEIVNALDYINPAVLNYQEWLDIGMALKYEGCSVEVWDDWSRNDSRYHSGECERKWESFNGSSTPVTGATVFQMARQNGYKSGSGHELSWNDEICFDGENAPDEPQENVSQLITYLETLFETNENVGYVTECWEKDGKFLPGRGHCDRTAGQLIEALSKCGGDTGAVLGDYNKEAGAWIRFNPLDGKGIKNENVTDYRYTLVECDNMELSKQREIIEQLKLPVACMVYSGKKSVHAVVHVDADSKEEYRKRVEYIYRICQESGLTVDTQNKNPSRLSRMPGVMRNGKVQELMAVNIGFGSFDEWKDYTEAENDNLPDEDNLADVWNDMPELAPPLIDGVLRQGHKMLLAGPSKAGKSFALIELCIAIAEGKTWFGWNCAQGKILYVNLELDRASCLHRFKDVYKALGFTPHNLHNIDIWNLRGKSVPMDNLAPKLIRRAKQKGYIAVVIDPIYKVITGDENSADQMAAFCNQFDKICTELNTAVIYCHHHSKGSQAGKRTMDRASGSGVFARDPDALLDMSELPLSDSIIKQLENNAVCKVCCKWLDRFDKLSEVSKDDMCSEVVMRGICKAELPENSYELMMQETETARKNVQGRTAWRIDGTLREFAKFPPVDVWFGYPLHIVDTTGILKDVTEKKSFYQRGTEKRKEQSADYNEKNRIRFENAVNFCNNGKPPTVNQIAEYIDNMPQSTLRGWINRFGYMIDKNTHTVIKKRDKNIDFHDQENAGRENYQSFITTIYIYGDEKEKVKTHMSRS